MKALLVLTVLTVYCSRTAVTQSLVFPQCRDTPILNYASSLDCTEPCSDRCYGALCSFYIANGYSALCNEIIIEICPNSVPTSCGAPSAKPCINEGSEAFVAKLPTFCLSENVSVQQQCSDQCAGAVCNYFKSTPGYSSVCSALAGEPCRARNATVPVACGTMVTVTMEVMTAAVLLSLAVMLLLFAACFRAFVIPCVVCSCFVTIQSLIILYA